MEKKAEQTQGINNLQLIASKVCLYFRSNQTVLVKYIYIYKYCFQQVNVRFKFTPKNHIFPPWYKTGGGRAAAVHCSV